MFEKNEEIYILDGANFTRNKTLRVLKRTFKYYRNQDKDVVCCTGKTDLDIAAWAVSKTEDEAYKLGMIYIINTLVLNKPINKGNPQIDYDFIELNHADLILKYADNIKVSQE